jgi:hypothetical protein
MSQRTITTDNLTDREVSESTHYHVTITDAPTGSRSVGDKYELDLTAESHDALIAMLTGKTAEFHKYMRRFVDGSPATGRTRGTSTRGTSRPATASNESPDETKRAREFLKASGHTATTVKEWGRANGLSEHVKDGPGVMPSVLVVAYAKAHDMPESPASTPEPPATDPPADTK